MNTDNMSILGLTIDYGPFGFLDAFDPGHICNHSDTQGRYAWARQPNVAFWNLHALGQALLPLIEDSDQALAATETYKTASRSRCSRASRAKLGLQTAEADDRELVDDLLRRMARRPRDFTITFRRLGGVPTRRPARRQRCPSRSVPGPRGVRSLGRPLRGSAAPRIQRRHRVPCE